MKPKFNKTEIMLMAWKLFKKEAKLPENKTDEMFSICLKKSWSIAKAKSKLNFNAIYKEYQPQVLNRLKMSIKNTDECEDICIEVFIKVNEFLGIFDCTKASLKTWIFKIADNKVIDYSRKKDEEVSISDFVNDEGAECFNYASPDSASKNIESMEIGSKIEIAISGLKPKYRQIADLFYVQQLSYKEIAVELQIPMNNVKVTMMRAKLMLQNALQKDYAMLGN